MTINQYLLLFGSIIFIVGIAFLIFSKKYFNIAYFKSEEYQILYNHLPLFCITNITYPTPVTVLVKINLIDKLKTDFIFKITGYPIYSHLNNSNLKLPVFSNEKFDIEKKGKTGKTYNFKFNPEYQYELNLEFKNIHFYDNKIRIGELEHELTNNKIGKYNIKIIKIERPYEWLFPVGLSLLTIGTVIFVAGIN